MGKYKKIILDFETTGLDPCIDEILQVSIIDQDNNILINEYCKPNILKEWNEAETIHGITPGMVEDKKSFENHTKTVSDILNDAETIIIYNAEFELNFLMKYNIRINSNIKIYDLMIHFSEVYGEWNEYYCNYSWKSLEECSLYYGYNLKNAHDSLEDCKATLYCYNKLIAKEGRYEAKEYIGKTLKEFWNEVIKKFDKVNILIKNINGVRYLEDIKSLDDIKYRSLLDCKIEKVDFRNFNSYIIYVEKCIEAEFDLKDKLIKVLEKRLNSERERTNELSNENKKLEEKNKKLEAKNLKLKEKLGLIEKPKIDKFNSYGYYTAEYCRSTRKPMFKYSSEYEPFADKLLSKSKCKQIKQPIRENEEIYAFYRVKNGYCALYFREDIKTNKSNKINYNDGN